MWWFSRGVHSLFSVRHTVILLQIWIKYSNIQQYIPQQWRDIVRSLIKVMSNILGSSWALFVFHSLASSSHSDSCNLLSSQINCFHYENVWLVFMKFLPNLLKYPFVFVEFKLITMFGVLRSQSVSWQQKLKLLGRLFRSYQM